VASLPPPVFAFILAWIFHEFELIGA
jgi:hypothetical protein